MPAPKLFISYSWSSPEHEQWVLNLATELRQSGVDVILDKWDLKEGHDAIKFMEQMVTAPDISKVAIISDKVYAAKADNRAGGVGTETQIISRKVYEKQEQEKFVAVVCEKDDNGKPFLPTYYKSRIYVDLSEADRYVENFEKLLRWVFDKPLYPKPEFGNRPAFLDNVAHTSLGTTARFKRCSEAIKNARPYALGALDEYCSIFAENLERFRLTLPDSSLDEAVMKSINEFVPFRNEAIQIFTTIAQYSQTTDYTQKIHRFFEKLIPYMHRPTDMHRWREWDSDNFRFIVHELFLYALSILLQYERFEQAQYLLEQQYYLPESLGSRGDAAESYGHAFEWTMRSLERRERGPQGITFRAKLLKERNTGTGIDFRYLMQADFVALMRAEVTDTFWFPLTLAYVGRFGRVFEIFARSVSSAYFDRVKGLLAIKSPADLKPLLEDYRNGVRRLPHFGFTRLDPEVLLGFEQLATRA